MCWAKLPGGAGSQETLFQGQEQPLPPESSPPVAVTQSPARLAFTDVPIVIADHPACCSSSPQG